VAKFARRRIVAATDSLNDAQSRAAIGGETSVHADPPELPEGVRSASFEDFDPALYDTSAVPPVGYHEDDDAEDDDETDAADESAEDEERDLASVG